MTGEARGVHPLEDLGANRVSTKKRLGGPLPGSGCKRCASFTADSISQAMAANTQVDGRRVSETGEVSEREREIPHGRVCSQQLGLECFQNKRSGGLR